MTNKIIVVSGEALSMIQSSVPNYDNELAGLKKFFQQNIHSRTDYLNKKNIVDLLFQKKYIHQIEYPAKPNLIHQAIKDLEKNNALAIFNLVQDNLFNQIDLQTQNLFFFRGEIAKTYCFKCKKKIQRVEILQPKCPKCSKEPHIDYAFPNELLHSIDKFHQALYMINTIVAIGVNEYNKQLFDLFQIAKKLKKKLILINFNQRTQYDILFDKKFYCNHFEEDGASYIQNLNKFLTP